MKRVVLHWSAGAYGVIPLEANAYHFLINRDGSVSRGVFDPEDNRPPLRRGGYAAHTLNLNSDSIGIAVDAMGDANERPFSAGRWPITNEQIDALVQLTADLCGKYRIPVTRETVLSHAEVQATLGVAQKNKWDIAWLPGMTAPGNPVEIGDQIRRRVQVARNERMKAEVAPEVAHPASSSSAPLSLRRLIEAILSVFLNPRGKP